MTDQTYDCIIIGGGIAGLTAGIYLSRFNCKVCLIDDNDSRATLITCSHNFPAFPAGISGNDILSRMRKQYGNYHQKLINDTVKKIKKNKKGFTVKSTHATYQSQFVILATGIVNLEPPIPNLRSAIKDGLIRHCLICDGYEAAGKKIVIIGDSKSCIKKAFLLACYSKDLTVLNVGNKLKFNSAEKQKIKTCHIKIIDGKNSKVIVENKKIKSIKTDIGMLDFDIIYSALGVIARSELAINLNAKHDKNKLLIVNKHQETSVKGLYAIGDVTNSVNQMCIATSHGAIAAINIFNKLND